jgi:heparan-alpha-glucosaminide N-acetyltransferase
MILGLIAGRWLRSAAPKIPMKQSLIAGVAGIATGLFFHFNICPIVKRIWTPSWTLFSGGACFLLLAGFCWIMEVKRKKGWAFPLVVIGMNSIAAYWIAHFMEKFLTSSFRIHLGPQFFQFFGTGLEPLLEGAAILTCYWLVPLWMYRRKLFLKI